jgi:hypothetical protein
MPLLGELIDAVVALRRRGYAVVLFSPEELDGCSADRLEGRLVELAWDEMDRIKSYDKEEGQ